EVSWNGQVAWADKLTPEARKQLLQLMKLPANTGPRTWWLTEFEDPWPYQPAPADVYFSRDPNQKSLHRPPIIQYVSSGWPSDVSQEKDERLLSPNQSARPARRSLLLSSPSICSFPLLSGMTSFPW